MTVCKKQTRALQWLNPTATAQTPVNNVAIIQNALETLPKHNKHRKWKYINAKAKDNRIQNIRWSLNLSFKNVGSAAGHSLSPGDVTDDICMTQW